MLRVFNTLSRRLEEFKPLKENQVGIYVCGPTVYDWAHLGHARTYIVFDSIIRWLEYKGFTVTYVQNITDVGHLTTETAEDKIVKRAREKKIEPMQLAEVYIREYFRDLDSLGVMRPHLSPRATGHLIDVIVAIRSLIAGGHAYEVNGNVFFDVSKAENYGCLSKIKPEDMLMGSRFEIHPDKKNPRDFALWKKAGNGASLTYWSPWGYGFPGWHIECAVMGLRYLGPQFDIHGGARDLIFPHHDNEIALCEALTGKKPFVKYWLHTGFLTINGAKMSKSLGNYITVRAALEKYDAEVIRLFILSNHYRSQVDLTDKKMSDAETSLKRLYGSLEYLDDALRARVASSGSGLAETELEIEHAVQRHKDAFINAMDEDFNTPKALAVLFDLSREVNKLVEKKKQVSSMLLKNIYDLFLELGNVFGLFQKRGRKKHDENLVNNLISLLVELRNDLRSKGDFALSDAIRTQLKKMGVIVEDASEGSKWRLA